MDEISNEKKLEPTPASSTSASGLGEFLRSEREKRHITIEQVASATKINIRQLVALESDNYDVLPAKPFVRGFVNSYARYIGLDPNEILARFDTFLNEKTGKKFERPADAPHIFVEQEGTTDNSKTVLSIVMVSFLVGAAILFAVIKPSLKHKKGRHKEKVTISNDDLVTVVPPPTDSSPIKATQPAKPAPASITQAPAPVASPAPAPTPTTVAKVAPPPSPKPTASPKPQASPSPSPTASIPANEVRYLLVIRAKEDSWVKYQADEMPIKQFTLRTGKMVFVRARKSIRFASGNPKGIEISRDNKNFQSLDASSRTIVVPKEASPEFVNSPSQ